MSDVNEAIKLLRTLHAPEDYGLGAPRLICPECDYEGIREYPCSTIQILDQIQPIDGDQK